MSQFLTTDIIAALFPTKIGDAKQFIVTSQEGSAGKLKIYKKIGARFRFALHEDDGGGGTFYDVGNVTSVTFMIVKAGVNYVLRTQAGPWPNLEVAQWNNGLKPTSQHFLFEFSSTELNLAPGEYTLAIVGNTDDPLAPADFYVEADLEVLARADATDNADALDDDAILEAVHRETQAALASKVDKIGAPGDSFSLSALNTDTGKIERIIVQAVWSPEQGPVFAANPEVLS
jgi:hypothetical protein